MKLKRSGIFASVLRAGKQQSRRFGSTQLLLGASLITLVGQQAKAQDLFWDNLATPTGTWDAALEWDTDPGLLSATNVAWVPGSKANFNQITGGTVSLVGIQIADTINASTNVGGGTSTWILANGGGGLLQLTGSGSISAGLNDTLTLNLGVDGAAPGQALDVSTGGGTSNVTLAGNIGANIGAITSSGVLTLSGTNTFTGPLTVTGGNTTLQGGNAVTNSAGLTLTNSATVTLLSSETVGDLTGAAGTTINSGGNTLSVNQVGTTTFAGAINGTAGFTKNVSGILTLSGSNGYSGRTTVTAGTLVAANDQALGTGNGVNDDTIISTGATVALGDAYTSNEYFQLNGNGDSANMALGALDTKGVVTLNGDSFDDSIGVSGSTTVSSSASGMTAGFLTINGDIIGAGPLEPDILTFSVAAGATIDVNDEIANSVEGIVKTGQGILDLTGSNANYTGAPGGNNTVITDGVIIINQNIDLGDAGNLLFNGGALELPTLRVITNDVSNDDGGFDRDIILGGAFSQVDVIGAGIDFNVDNNDLIFNSPTNTLRKLGTGELNIDTNVGGVGNGDAALIDGILDPHTGTINVLGSGFSGVNPAFLAGGVPAPGTTSLTLAGLGDADGGQTGTINLGRTPSAEFGANNEFDIVVIDQTANTIFDGTLNTTGDLLVTGTGNLKLNGSVNTLGNIHISGTELLATTSTALSGNINSHDSQATFIWGRFNDPLIPTALLTPGKLSLSGGITLNERLTIVNDGILNNAAGVNTIGSAVRVRFDGSLPFSTVAGPFSARIGATNGQLILQGGIFSNPGQTINLNGLNTDAGTVTVAGPIQSTVADVLLGNSSNTTNTVDLQVQNFYSGNTTINGGTVIVGNNQSLSGSDVTVNAAASLKSSGNVALANDIALNATLTTGAAGNTLGLNGEITGSGGITNAGGTTTLGGNNTYTGATLVNVGTFNINGTSNSNDLQVAAGATLTTNGSDKLSDGATLVASGTVGIGGNETLTALTVNSGGLVTVNGKLTGIGNTTTVNLGGTLSVGSLVDTNVVVTGALNSTGDITTIALNGTPATGVISFGANTLTAQSGTYTGNLVGVNGSLVKNGGGLLNVTGDNSGLTGTTTVNNGTLAANNLGSTTVDIKTAGQLTASGNFSATNINVAQGATLQADAVIAAAANVNNSGTVNITTGPNNTFNSLNFNAASGLVNVSGGSLAVGTLNGAAGTLNLAANNFTAGSGNFAGSIIGSGTLTKASGGALTLSGNNNGFTGPATVALGTLALQSAFGSNAITVNAAGNLTTSANEQLANTATLTADGIVSLGGAETIGTLNGSGTVNAAGNLNVTTLDGSAQINAGANTVTAKNGTFGGSIDGNGGLTKNTLGTLSLTAANTYTGTTQINAGTLALAGTLQSTAVNVANGASLTSTGGNLFGGSSLANNGQVTINGDETITSYASGGPGVNGSLLGTGTLTASTYALNDGSTVTANTGTGIITTNGAVTINATSTGASALNVQTGVLDASGTFAANQIGVNSGATINSNGMLAATANVVVGGTMNVVGVVGAPATTTVQTLSITPASGIVNLTSGSLITTGLNGSGTLNLGANNLTAASGTFSGTIDGGGSLTKVGGSTLTLAGTNSYTGATNINAGTLSLQSDLASLAINIANGAFLTTSEAEQLANAAIVDTFSTGTLALGGSETIGQLNGAGAVILGANTLTLTNGGNFSGNISGTGETIVTGGTFTVSAVGGLNSNDLDIQAGTTLTTTAANLIGNTTKVNNDGIVNLGGNDTVGSYTSTGTLNGPGTLTASIYKLNGGSIVNTNTGAGIMTTNGLVQLSAATTTGASAITIQSGTLTANGTTLATALTVNAGASLNSNGTLSNLPTLEVSGTANLNTVTSLTSLGANAPGLVEINAASLTTTDLHGDGIVDLNANILNVSEGAFSGTLRGSGILNKENAGLLSLSGTNSHTGITNVNAGTLNAVTALNTRELNVLTGATYLNTGGLINPNVTISNNGIVTLFGNEQGSVYNSVGGTLNGAGTLTAPTYNLRDGANTIQGVHLGTGVLNSLAGSVTLLGNSAANDVNVLAGTLNVGGNLGSTGATVDISSLATLALLLDPSLGIDGDIADTAIVNNAGTLTLAGDDLIAIYNANAGALTGPGTVTAGTYNLSNGASTAAGSNLGEGVLNIVDVNPPAGSDPAVILNGLAGANTVNINLTTTLNLGAFELLDDSAVVTNRGTLNLNGIETVGTFISSGTLGGTGTLIGTGNTLTLQNGHTSLVNTMLQDFGPNPNLTSQGVVNINGSNNQGTATNARINVNTAIIQTGTMNLNGLFINNAGSLTIDFGAALVSGFSDRIANGATVDNGGTWTLGGNDTIASYTSTGLLSGAGSTLTALNYFLNNGSVVDANIGTGTVQSNGTVALNGTSAAAIVNIQTGNLTLGSAERLNDSAAVTNGAMLTLNGNEIVGSYTSNAGSLAGSGVLTAQTFALNDNSTTGASTTLGDIAMGSSQLTTNGQVQLDGTSNVDKVTIAGGSLNGAGPLNYALLEGNGTLNRSLTNLVGDTVNPGIENGNPIGQLTIAGDFANQGNLVIDFNALDGAFDSSNVLSAANHDRLIVNGPNGTNLNGGNVILKKVAGSREFNAGESALVVVSAAPITMDDFATYDSSDYAGRMFFDVRNGTVVGAGVDAPEDLGELVGLTENQSVIAEAADFSISAGDMLDNTLAADKIALAIVGAYNGNSHGALNQLSPEGYAGMTDYGIQATKAYTTAALSMPGTSANGTVKTVRIPMGTPAPAPQAVKSATTSVFAGFAHFDTASDSSKDNADYDITSNGGIAGVRHEVGGFTIAGFIGVDQGDLSSRTIDSDADGFLLGAIASFVIQPEMNLIATGGITYGSYEFDGDRQSLLGTVDFNADSDVFDVHFGIEADAYSTDKFRLSPFLQLHYVTSETDGFTESGNGSALLVKGMDDDALFAEIGLKAEYQVTSRFSVNGNVSYTHNFMDSDRDVSAALGGAAFTVNSPGLGEDFIGVGIGAQFQATESLRFGINYRAEFSNDSDTSNGVSLGASYSF